jgi:Domain of unknown function (DUF5668)
MNCAYHPEIQADAYCRTCGKALCTACKRDVKGVIYCEDCIAARVVDTIPAAIPATGKIPGAPNPAVATLLGFIPGVGAMYNGQFAKAFAHILIFAAAIAAVTQMNGPAGGTFFGLFIAGFYFYMVFDAYKTARAKELGEPLPDPFGLASMFGEAPPPPARTTTAPDAATAAAPLYAGQQPPPYVAAPVERASRGPVGAFLLIGIGVIFLLSSMDYINFSFDRLWPVAVIVVGVWMFFTRRPACHCQRCQTRCLMGPAMVVTVGVLFLLQQTTYTIGLHRTWPVFLLVVGAVQLAQSRASMEGHITPVTPASVAPQSTALAPTGPGAASDRNSEVTNV